MVLTKVSKESNLVKSLHDCIFFGIGSAFAVANLKKEGFKPRRRIATFLQRLFIVLMVS